MSRFQSDLTKLSLQSRFMVVVGAGILMLAACTLTVVAWSEFSNLENKLRTFAENELRSLNSLVESAMEQRLSDQQNVAIKVFNGWFESRNKEYPGKLWSVWDPKTRAYMAKTAPEQTAKLPSTRSTKRRCGRAGRSGASWTTPIATACRSSRANGGDRKECCAGCHTG